VRAWARRERRALSNVRALGNFAFGFELSGYVDLSGRLPQPPDNVRRVLATGTPASTGVLSFHCHCFTPWFSRVRQVLISRHDPAGRAPHPLPLGAALEHSPTARAEIVTILHHAGADATDIRDIRATQPCELIVERLGTRLSKRPLKHTNMNGVQSRAAK